MPSPSAAGGRVLAAFFGTVGRLRTGKPLHPQGVTLAATLTRHGATPPFGVPWLDEPGTDAVDLRVSRAVGLPAWSPDVPGLALRVPTSSGFGDLLLATTGRGRLGRFLLVPRRRWAGAFHGSLLPYVAAGRLVELGAEPVDARALPVGPAALSDELRRRPLELRLLAAPLVGNWRWFATVTVSGDVRPEPTFDPVLNPLPGLAVPGWARRLREPSYAAARRTH